ncbi:MAG: DNA helicase PcrA [Firmicutes bacterium]|nr:DNA helicase PcrA [Bacillota bacterium]
MVLPFIGKLNPSQEEAVRHGEGPLLILAGAGSGKTRVLTHRIAYLIQEHGVSPSSILAITFTNKAAETMKTRLRALIPEFRMFWVTTFHSAANRILRQEIEALGYHKDFNIYDDADQVTLVKEGIRHFNWDEKVVSPRGVAARISDAKNKLLTSDDYFEQAGTQFEFKVAQLYRWYQSKLKENNALDFDDLIMLTVRLFQEHPTVLSYYQNKFKYILVDEYQDTNHAQYLMVQLLAARHHNLCVVGDPDQSIYGWRGANLNNILNFKQDYPEAVEVKLEQNYRSTSTILEAANHVIKNNRNRFPKELWTSKDEGEPIAVYTGEDERDESGFVASTIQELNRRGMPFTGFAVFYRTHAQSRVLEESMLRYGIPYRVIGGLRFYQRKEIKDLLAYLKLVSNPSDNLSLQRIINTPRRGIGETTWNKVVEEAGRLELPYYAVIPGLLVDPQFPARNKKPLESFYKMMEELRAQGDTKGITQLADDILDKTGYRRELIAENTVESKTRLENLEEFLSVTEDYDLGKIEMIEDEELSEELGLAHFLARISLVTDIEEYREDEETVTLMTVHAAKGMEFPVVFVTGLEEDVFPHSQARYSSEEMEEERRLCYVALTRAEEKLYLTRAECRTLFGFMRNNPASRFLTEIPARLMDGPLAVEPAPEPVRNKTEYVQNKPRNQAHTTSRPAAARAPEAPKGGSGLNLSVGDRVLHKKWGKGVVVQVKGEGEDRQVSVAFPELGIKQLLQKYAPLTVVSGQ